MIARTRQTRSRSPRGHNETLRAMASFPAGFTTPQERERVSVLVHEDTVDFHDPLLAVSETLMAPTPRLNIARELEPTRPAVVVRPPFSPNIDLTTAQMFVDGCPEHHHDKSHQKDHQPSWPFYRRTIATLRTYSRTFARYASPCTRTHPDRYTCCN